MKLNRYNLDVYLYICSISVLYEDLHFGGSSGTACRRYTLKWSCQLQAAAKFAHRCMKPPIHMQHGTVAHHRLSMQMAPYLLKHPIKAILNTIEHHKLWDTIACFRETKKNKPAWRSPRMTPRFMSALISCPRFIPPAAGYRHNNIYVQNRCSCTVY